MPGWIIEILENRIVQNLIALIAGALLTVVIGAVRRKMARLQYTVTHNRIGISAEDALFGNVKLTWQNTPVQNLHMSVLDISNASTEDFANLEVRIYSGNDTVMLNERTGISDSPYIVTHSPAYSARIHVPPGQQPTQQQFQEYWHNREYLVLVLNRGQKLTFHYLTTVPGGGAPAIWAATLHKGLRLRYVPNVQMTMGVPVPAAALMGIVIGLVLLVPIGLFVSAASLAAVIGFAIGLFAQLLGALCIRAGSAVRRALYH